jgi:hypothetical protein
LALMRCMVVCRLCVPVFERLCSLG